MNRLAVIALSLILATPRLGRGAEPAAPALEKLAEYHQGQYQVLAQDGLAVARQVHGFMTQMLQQYSRFFGNWSPKAAARVVVFDNRADFLAYSAALTRQWNTNLLGYCHLKTDAAGQQFYELVTFAHEELWGTLAHEGFHQFIGHELGQEIPPWLNEGLAQYFETSTIVRGKFQTGGVHPTALRNTQALLQTGQAPPLATLTGWDRANFYTNAQTAYPLSWALVYYLLENEGRSFHNTAFRRYLQDLKWGRAHSRTFAQRFGRDPEKLQAAFQNYLLQLQP